MRNLIISVLAVTLLMGIWLVFSAYSDDQINSLTTIIETEIIPAAQSESWDECTQHVSELNAGWERYKKTALLFLSTEQINEIDVSLAKATKYVQAQDASNSSGEFLGISRQLQFLSAGEKINSANIF